MLTLLGTFPANYDDLRLKRKLRALPDPRFAGVAVSTQISFVFLVMLLIAFATSIGQSIRDDWKTNGLAALLWASMVIFLAWVWLRELRNELRNRSLLEKGAIAVGRIASQIEVKAGKGTRRSEITYTFADASGQKWNGTGSDHTKKYVPNMPVIVFYELIAPQHNVAACATVWKLRGLDGEFLDLD